MEEPIRPESVLLCISQAVAGGENGGRGKGIMTKDDKAHKLIMASSRGHVNRSVRTWQVTPHKTWSFLQDGSK